MPIANQQITSLVKGLLTERQELVFVPDASVDELNCSLEIDGTRRRRKGIEYEDNHQLSSYTVDDITPVFENTWVNVGGVPNLEFLVVQVGTTLYFYSKASVPFSAGVQSFTVDLTSFSASNGVSIINNGFQGDSLDGVYVVVHPALNPFYITYDKDTETISTTVISPKTRDFDWQGDTSDYFENTAGATTTAEREYDTLNAGWVPTNFQDPLAGYLSIVNQYPALTHPWFTGKDSIGQFNQDNWNKVYAGTSLTANGHYILDFFNKDRESIVAGLGIETETSRFTSVAAFAGRFWYAGLESETNSGTIIFTKVIENERDYNICYQENDPTSEEISDLLDSDGGVIRIPEAYGIDKLFVFGANLIVFANNGIWAIKGVDEVFKATEFSVSKISSVGLTNNKAFVNAENTPFWWSKVGIHTLLADSVSTQPVEQNVTVQTIQSFWDQINVDKAQDTKGIYDQINKKILWLYKDNDETIVSKYNNLLIFDIQLQAFTPWSVSDQATNSNHIVGMSFFSELASVGTQTQVTAEGVDVTAGGVDVTALSFDDIQVENIDVQFLVRDGTTNQVTFAAFTNTDLLDWEDTIYSSYVEVGYVTFDSLAVRKHPMHCVTYFKVTESGFSDNGDGSYDLLTPSGCTLKAFWDFNSNPSSTQNVYRLKRIPVVDENNLDEFNYGNDILINRTRLKGRGRVMNLRFESQDQKDFVLLGYELIGFVNEGL